MKYNKSILKILLIIGIIISSVIYATNEEKSTLKRITLTPDIDGDGKSDQILVDYFEDEENVYTRFTPVIKEGKKWEALDRVFEKSKFSMEFPIYVNEYIESYKNKLNLKKDIVEKNGINNDKEIEKKVETENVNGLVRGVYPYVEYYLKERPKNLTFNYKYKKYSPMDLDEFLFIRSGVGIRKEPKISASIIKNASYGQKYKVVGKISVPNGKGGNSQWYEVEINGKLGYLSASSKIALKREFDWHDMMKKIEKTNKFIVEELSKNRKIYVLDDYTPLGGGSGTAKDKFGNRENQSERAYVDSEMKGEFINVPDRTLLTIIDENDKYIKVKIDAYNGNYYMKKNIKRLLKDSGIVGEITRFIYMDRKSQNEIIVEKDIENDSWNVVTTSFVTTGKDGATSYATPFGVFLIAYSKPVMQYTGEDITKIVGDARNAVRFSGGGYMHSIPSLFEPKETRDARKAATARKIGTFPESHKCVRHYDEQIKFIYDWLGNSTPGHKFGYRYPIMPTVVLVK